MRSGDQEEAVVEEEDVVVDESVIAGGSLFAKLQEVAFNLYTLAVPFGTYKSASSSSPAHDNKHRRRERGKEEKEEKKGIYLCIEC